MELKAVTIMTLADVFFVLYLTRQCKTVLPLLTVATIIYTVSYVVPFYLQFDETTYGISVFDESFAFKAVCYFYSFKYSINLLYFIKLSHANNNNLKTGDCYKYNINIGYNTIFYFIIMAFIVQIVSINDIAQIINPIDRFFSDNPIVTNSMTVLLLILFAIFYVIYAISERKNRLMLVMALGMSIFYTVLISSRGVILPFLIMASVQLIVNRKYLMSIIYLFVSILFYIAAISGRTELGIGNFITKLSTSFFMIGDFFNIFVMSVSGIATLTATLSGLDSGSVDVKPDLLLFLLYISPIPSFLLSARIFDYTSLSPYLGIDPSVLGINADFISESIMWMSWYGPACIGVIIGYIFSSVDSSSLKKDNIIFRSLFFISSLFFILFSNIAALRASSRFLMYSYLLYLLYNQFHIRMKPRAMPLTKD